MKPITILLILIVLFSCAEKKELDTAQRIIDAAIETSCNGNCEHAIIDFSFRNKHYKSVRREGMYQLTRFSEDSSGTYKDVLTNNGFMRYKNDQLEALEDSTAQKLSDAVNSVHYFAQLPFGLNTPAVKKKLLEEITIKGKKYYSIGISFSEDGGGTDFDDQFVYWIQKETYTVDYLAYSYAVNGGGIRFREAYNERVVEGIRFVDYNNYKPASLKVSLTDLPKLLEKGELTLLSKIETENVKVVLQN